MGADILPTQNSNISYDFVYFLYDVGNKGFHEHPIYNVHPENGLPKAAFIAFDLAYHCEFFLADHSPDQTELEKPSWKNSIVKIPISPLVTYNDLKKLSEDSYFYDMYTRLLSGYMYETYHNPHEYTDKAKLCFLEIGAYLKKIPVPKIVNHLGYYEKLKSRQRPTTNN